MKIFKLRIILTGLIVGCALALSSCVTPTSTFDNGPGSLLARGPLSGELGNGLDPISLSKAINAEVAALSNAATGSAVEWMGSKNTKGRVVPGQLFEVAGRTCRQYTHIIASAGVEKRDTATACMNEDKIWEPLR